MNQQAHLIPRESPESINEGNHQENSRNNFNFSGIPSPVERTLLDDIRNIYREVRLHGFCDGLIYFLICSKMRISLANGEASV